jgi:prolyl-tRNA synthetase
MNCRYLDATGQTRSVIMGCYGIGVTRMAAAWIEQNHDDKGIIWSPQISPFDIHLIGLNLEDATVSTQAEQIYQKLIQAGFSVLFDDRPARAGEKFSDADLIGIPARLTISKRTLEQGKVEFKLRNQPKAEVITLEEAQQRVRATASRG